MALFYSRVGSRNRVFQSGFLSVDCLIKTARTFSSQNSHVFRGFSDTVLTLKSLTDWSQGCLQMKKTGEKMVSGQCTMDWRKFTQKCEHTRSTKWPQNCRSASGTLDNFLDNLDYCYDFCRQFEAILHQFSEWLSIFFFDQISRPFFKQNSTYATKERKFFFSVDLPNLRCFFDELHLVF